MVSNGMVRLVLYCIVLYCIVLYCIVLYCIVLYCDIFDGNFSLRSFYEFSSFKLGLFDLNILPKCT